MKSSIQEISSKNITVSIIIVNYNTPKLTKDSIEAVHLAMSGTEYEIIVVDNGSSDGSYNVLSELEDENTHILSSLHNGGFGYGNNIGANKSKGKYLFFLNSDTILYSTVLNEMLQFLEEHRDFGILSCLMEDGNNKPLVIGHKFESLSTIFLQTIVKPLVPSFLKNIRAKNNHKSTVGVKEYDWVSGAAMLIKRDLFLRSGGWNEIFFMYMEDEELCFRIRNLGYKIGVLHKIGLQHLVGKSGGSAFVGYEKYKSAKKFFRLINARYQWAINLLIYIQSYSYMKGIDRQTRLNIIKRLIKI